MITLTGSLRRKSEQNVELGASWVWRDNANLEKIIHWFDDHDPFDINDPSLCSLSTGLYTEEADRINCDEAKLVGERLQNLLDNKSMHDAKLPRKEKVKTIANLNPGVQIENTIIHIDPSIMFMRLMAIMHQEGYVED